MAYKDLREFISALDKAGELKRVSVEVDPHLEITEFADRAVKQGGPALLFEKPQGYSTPVLINHWLLPKPMSWQPAARTCAAQPEGLPGHPLP